MPKGYENFSLTMSNKTTISNLNAAEENIVKPMTLIECTSIFFYFTKMLLFKLANPVDKYLFVIQYCSCFTTVVVNKINCKKDFLSLLLPIPGFKLIFCNVRITPNFDYACTDCYSYITE